MREDVILSELYRVCFDSLGDFEKVLDRSSKIFRESMYTQFTVHRRPSSLDSPQQPTINDLPRMATGHRSDRKASS
jgi:hypothetical protein